MAAKTKDQRGHRERSDNCRQARRVPGSGDGVTAWARMTTQTPMSVPTARDRGNLAAGPELRKGPRRRGPTRRTPMPPGWPGEGSTPGCSPDGVRTGMPPRPAMTTPAMNQAAGSFRAPLRTPATRRVPGGRRCRPTAPAAGWPDEEDRPRRQVADTLGQDRAFEDGNLRRSAGGIKGIELDEVEQPDGGLVVAGGTRRMDTGRMTATIATTDSAVRHCRRRCRS